jgi:hypothetical protein
MNEPIDDKHEDAQISSLYQKASAEQPPAHLDAAILAAAKREVHAKPRSLSPFSTKWTLPFSLAAVVVLSVSIITLVQKESPMEMTGGADHLSNVAETTVARKEEKIATLKRQAAAPHAESELSSTTTPKMMKVPREITESRERLTESPALMLRQPADNEVGATSSDLSSQITLDDTTADSVPRSSVTGALADTQSISAPSNAQHLAKSIVKDEETRVADSTASGSSAASTAIQETDQSERQPSRQVLAFRAEPQEQSQEQTQEQPKPAVTQPQLPASVMSGPQQIAEPEIAAAARPSSAPSCHALNARVCLQSPQCTYVLSDEIDHHYICRDAANRCEQGFNQLQDTKQNCESKSGCRFIPGYCECPEGLPCDCRSKNPPQCVKQ